MNGPFSYPSDVLAKRARDSQRAARSREALPGDNFLVSGPTATVQDGDPVYAPPITEPEMARSCGQFASNARGNHFEGFYESFIRKTFELQDPSGAARFKLGNGAESHHSLPGGAPIVDHLYVRAQAERDWSFLLPALDGIRQTRCPSVDSNIYNLDITLGLAHPSVLQSAISFLKKRTEEVEATYHVCQLAGDAESISVPPDVFEDIMNMPPGTDHTFQLAEDSEPARHLMTRFTFGHVGWQITFRLPIREGEGKTMHLSPGTLQTDFWVLLAEVKSLVGVGIKKDLDDFAAIVKSLYGIDGVFPKPIELHTTVRLAGFNLPRHAVGNLAWIFLGALLPKGRCSAGDGRWHQRWGDLPKALQCYLAGDISQVAAIFWLATNAWIMHLFPDLHIVSLVSKITTGPELLRWWTKTVIPALPSGPDNNKPWTPAETRAEMLDRIFNNPEDRAFFASLIPDWPSPVAGGCRFFHTARIFIVDCIPQFRHLDSEMWPLCYKEQYYLFLFGRKDVPPQPSPTAPATSNALGPNPGMEGMLHGPAKSLSCGKLGQAVMPGFSLRSRILEYARAYPLEAAKFLTRLEETKEAASRLLPYIQKVHEIIWNLRDLLSLLGLLPNRPSDWEDFYPPREMAPKVKMFEAAADKKIAQTREKTLALLAVNRQFIKAVRDGRNNPPPRLDLRSDLKNLLHPKGPGKASKDKELYLRIGAPAPQCSTKKRSRSISAHSSGDLREQLCQLRSSKPAEQYRSPPPPLPGRSETVTSGAYESSYQAREEVTVESTPVASRKVHYKEYQRRVEDYSSYQDADEPPAKRVSTAAAAAFIDIRRPNNRFEPELTRPSPPSVSSWVSTAPVATVNDSDTMGLDAVVHHLKPLNVNIKRMFIVGRDQAKRLSWGLAALLPQLEIRYISVPSADQHGFLSAADELSSFNLSKAYVLAWLYDDRCFTQANSGSGLEISTYDDSTHCIGPVGVIDRDQLVSLCNESKHLLHAMQDAVGSTLIAPLPQYLVNPCCELPDHCQHITDDHSAKLYCSDMVAMTYVIQRWASQEGFARTSVVCPHLELLIQMRADPWEGWITPLQECFGREAVHFSRWGYSRLAKQLWERIEEKYSEFENCSGSGSWRGSEDGGWFLGASASIRAQSGRRPWSRLLRPTERPRSERMSMYLPSKYKEGQYQSPDIEWD